MIKKLRVDYRLVHGQVAISWSRALGVDCILVANDEVAKDEMRQSMLRISKPQGIKLVIKSMEDSIKAIKSGVTDKYKLFIVVNNVKDVERLTDAVPEINDVNLGVLPAVEGSRALSKAINVTADDTETLKHLLSKGIRMEIQQVPTETAVKVTEKLLGYVNKSAACGADFRPLQNGIFFWVLHDLPTDCHFHADWTGSWRSGAGCDSWKRIGTNVYRVFSYRSGSESRLWLCGSYLYGICHYNNRRKGRGYYSCSADRPARRLYLYRV